MLLFYPGFLQVQAQSSQIFELIQSSDGLQQSIVYSITRDSFGNIWAGTEEGVVRYNSHETYLYNKYRGFADHVYNRASRLFVDAKQRIWMGTEEGLSHYDPLSDSFVPIRSSEGQGPSLVKQIVEDSHRQIWVGAFNGIWLYDTANARLLPVGGELNVVTLYADGDRIIVGTDRGLFVLDTQSRTLHPAPLNGVHNLSAITAIQRNANGFLIGTRDKGLFQTDSNLDNVRPFSLPLASGRAYPVTKILLDDRENIFLATDGAGLLYLDPSGKLLQRYKNDPNNPNSISSDGIYDMFLDKDNLLWIATYGGGINAFNLSANTFFTIEHRMNDTNSLAHNFTRSILEDSEGNIWFGTKEGISIWNRQREVWRHLPSLGLPLPEPDIVMALAEQGTYIWAGTYGRGAFRIRKSDFATTQFSKDSPPDRAINLMRIYAIEVDQSGNCWLGGIEEGLYRISPEGEQTVFPIGQIRQIVESRSGDIWVAGRFGVQRITKDSIVQLEELKNGKNGLSYTTVSTLYETEGGGLVIGTNGNGLIFYTPGKGVPSVIDPHNNLPSDIVQGILRDDDGVFWISTTRGLAKIILSEKDTLVSVYSKGDGLPGNEFNYGSYARLSDGAFAFGAVEGVALFYPERIGEMARVPKIVFEDFELLNTQRRRPDHPLPANINVVDEIKLKHFENALRIKYAGILHTNASKVVYSWKMEGLSSEWSEPDAEGQINFTNLSPGSYLFRVKAANRDGNWGAERQLRIIIADPWWATGMAYFIYVMLMLAALSGLGYLAGILIRKRNADEQIAFFRNITHELKTPLSILLSTLDQATQNNSTGGVATEKIKTTVKRLNTLFEQLLHFNRVSSGKTEPGEVAKIHLPTYVSQILNSFQPLLEETNLSVQVENQWKKEIFYYDRESLDKIFFNLISNAVKYSEKGGTIKINLVTGEEGRLLISIADEGIGIPKDQQKYILKRYYRGRNAINSQLPGTGLGLMIVKSLVEKGGGSIRFESLENKGTTFTVLLPDQKKLYIAATALTDTSLKAETQDKIAEFSDTKILIVEDNDELRHILVNEISTYFQVFEASNGREGLDMVRRMYPDLVITDMIMPNMDGMEMCRHLQDDINLNHIPVFMITVLSRQEYELESLERGIAAYIEKPIDFNVLLAKITATIGWQKKLSERYRHHADMETAEIFQNKRDADFINSLERFVLEKVNEENLSVHDLCRHLGMSRTALYMKLKNMVDLSPQNFIIHTRLKYARKLFIEKKYNVKEVAYLTGFSNPKYFSTSFKKLFGYSPIEFLKSLDN